MPTRGQQFPLHNTGYFNHPGPAGAGNLYHESAHRITWGGQGNHEDLGVAHRYDPESRTGSLVMHGEDGEVASLRYRIHEAERATSLRVQPVIHTDMVNVEQSHFGHGLGGEMMRRLQNAHPGVSHPASNELTEDGAAWRAARVNRGLDTGERIAHGPWEGDSSMHGPRLFRPVEREHAGIHKETGQPYDTRAWLMEAGHFDPHDTAGEDMEHDSWVSKASKIKKVPRNESIWG